MKQNTTVRLYLLSDCGSQVFENFSGHIPRIGDTVTFYKKMHDGCRYVGIVSKVEHRIEHKTQNDKSQKSLQTISVHIDESVE